MLIKNSLYKTDRTQVKPDMGGREWRYSKQRNENRLCVEEMLGSWRESDMEKAYIGIACCLIKICNSFE